MTEDTELLSRYADTRSEQAFAELVRRHVNLVHSVALRQVNGDSHLAQDVVQLVFSDLAKKAPVLRRQRVLAGWLFVATRFAAAKLVRSERRRKAREQEAQTMNEFVNDPASAPAWEQVRTVLDEAMGELDETDREAILLRFFENRGYADLGERLQLSENSARMRVERALDKLHGLLARRRVTSTTGALAVVLANQAVTAAPVGLAASVTGAVLTVTAAAAGVGTVATFMSMTKLQAGIIGALVVAGTSGLVLQQQANTRLARELGGLRQASAEHTTPQADSHRPPVPTAAAETLRREIDAELARLSEEANVLTQRLQREERAATAGTKVSPRPKAAGIIYDLSQLDQKPVVKFTKPPLYPAEEMKTGIAGEVQLEFILDPNGDVSAVQVIKSSNRNFEPSAIAALHQWKFEPLKKDGIAVSVRLQQQFIYTPKEEASAAPAAWF